MERNLVWASLAMGCIGWFCTFLLASRNGAKPETAPWPVQRTLLWLAVLLPLMVWVGTLPTSPPFSAGQGWGRGFLLGGGGALLSAMVIFRTLAHTPVGLSPSGLPLRAAASAALFAILPVVCIPLLFMRHAVIEALLGAALGWLAVTLVLFLGLKSTDKSTDASTSDSHHTIALLLTNGSAFATALCAAAALGVYRDFVVAGAVARGAYPSVAVNLAGSLSLALLAGGLAGEIVPGGASQAGRRSFSTSTIFSLLLGVVLPIGLAYLLALKVLNDLTVIYVIGLGLLLGLLLWWIVAGEGPAASTSPAKASLTPAAILVALCGFMLAYQLMQGFGVGLMLLAAWPVSLLALPIQPRGENTPVPERQHRQIEIAQLLTVLFSFLAILLLSRLFTMRFRADLRGTSLNDQYTLFGFLAGAAVPALLASLAFRGENERPGSAWSPLLQQPVSRVLVTGLLALALPGAMLALWGVKIIPAFFAGLGLVAAGFTPALLSRLQPLAVSLFALAIGAALTQWTTRLAPLAEASRAERLHILLWSLGGLVLVMLVIDYGARLANWRKPNNGPDTPAAKGASS